VDGKKGESKGIAILISLSFVLAIMVSLLYLLLMQMEFSMNGTIQKKLLEH
jgi:hypothetical protein